MGVPWKMSSKEGWTEQTDLSAGPFFSDAVTYSLLTDLL